jgi:methylenetetrahydrofolate--tRNA-(uracil-5-)-methyltransferase
MKARAAELIVIGGGLAGAEAAWQAARRGVQVTLFEMRPAKQTGAHLGGNLAELVCSNSLGSNQSDRAAGLLKAELRRLGSLVLACADQTALPAGGALAVDRDAFSALVTERVEQHPLIRLVREEVREIPAGAVVLATGPLTSPDMSASVRQLLGQEHLFFYDAIAPIVHFDSIDLEVAFRAARYERSEQPDGDYINCPFERDQYDAFVAALVAAERIELKDFEQPLEQGVTAGAGQFFEGCLPIEVLARRGKQSLAFGPLRPIGLLDPRSGRRPYAVLQLRQDNLAGDLYNLVGFQTNLTFSEQRRVFRMVPGLERAEFARYGQMHRNTYIYSPLHLQETMQSRRRADLFFAGQITGVEGYVGNIGSGLLAGWNAARFLNDQEPLGLPQTTMLGALCHYITHADQADFQPMKANFGILPDLGDSSIRGKRERAAAYSQRAMNSLETFLVNY